MNLWIVIYRREQLCKYIICIHNQIEAYLIRKSNPVSLFTNAKVAIIISQWGLKGCN